MSIDNDKLHRTEIMTSISNIQDTNTGARGDCLYLPMICNKTLLDSIDNKIKYQQSTLNFDCTNDNDFSSNLASGEPNKNQVCFSTSSETFIVSKLSPSEIIVQQDDQNIPNMIHSDTNMELFIPVRVCNNYQQELWFTQHWISMIVIIGIIIIFITIIITSIIH